MEYEELSKIYHKDSTTSRDKNLDAEEARRRSADSTFLTGFKMPQGELFLATPRELSVLNERILRTERKVSQLTRTMPPIACNAVLRSIVLDEVLSTNAIEDIHSTRRQIKDAIDSPHSANQQRRRFKELATLYLSILDGSAQIPETPEDVRSIYDQVMDGEIDESKRPDGRLFRKEGVDITSGIRILHHGIQPESALIEAMELMLRLTRLEDIPSVYAAVLSHCIFEYAHPFYDGNGRTGRYLLSLFLSESLSIPTVLSLSRTIAEDREAYYRCFRTVENSMNRGEATFFVYGLLELVHRAQLGVIDRLEKSKDTFGVLMEKIDIIESDLKLKSQEKEATFILLQYASFGLLGDVSIEEFAQYLGVGKQMARRHLGSLEKKKVVVKWSQRRPLSFVLTDEFKKRYGIETPDWQVPVA